MPTNPLLELQSLDQSVWLDFIQRRILVPGGLLEQLIRYDGLRGVTSNPSIFEKAIDGSAEYDDEIRTLARQGKSTRDIADALVLGDVAKAADLLRPTYEATGGADGFVSIEVTPTLAGDTSGSIAEARRLWTALDRPNVMVKIPGTKAGVPAIRALLREGINVNITLLFAVERYLEVQTAYVEALEERLRAGEPVDRLASVASFFVSRIDTIVDEALEKIVQAGGPDAETAKGLLGTIAIANARIAYQKWREGQDSARWRILARNRARPQRLLWASTSSKNPRYRDTTYVEALIAPHTVDTMPLETLEAYRDHGSPDVRIWDELQGAYRRIDQLRRLGIDLDDVTRRLEEEGVRKFVEPHRKLQESIEKKRLLVAGGTA